MRLRPFCREKGELEALVRDIRARYDASLPLPDDAPGTLLRYVDVLGDDYLDGYNDGLDESCACCDESCDCCDEDES